MNTAKSIQKVVICAKIKRADGSVEDLGEIATWHKKPVLHWIYKKIYTIRGWIKLWLQ